MGAGALEAPTTKLRQYPLFDPRTLNPLEQKKLVKLARAVWDHEQPIDWLADPKPGPKLQALDNWLLDLSGGRLTSHTLYADLAAACAARIAVAQDKSRTTKKKQIDNLTNVANGIADQVRLLLSSRQFPDNFVIDDPITTPFTINRKALRHIKIRPFLDQTTLTLTAETGKPILHGTYSKAVAEAVVRAVLIGRSSFEIPTERKAAEELVTGFLVWFDDIRRRVQVAINESAFGTGYEERLTMEVYRRLGISPLVGERTLPANIPLSPSPDPAG
jgi:hypothetical protein